MQFKQWSYSIADSSNSLVYLDNTSIFNFNLSTRRLNLSLLYDSLKYFIEEEAIDKPLIENIKINNVTKQLIYTYLRKYKVEIVDLSEIEEIENYQDENIEEYNSQCFSDDFINLYLKEASSYPLLTNEQEKDLFIRYNNGEKELKDILINSNLRLVISVARRYYNKTVELLDLIEYGNEGLIKAIDKFDVTKGYKFSTYATWWIRQAVTRGIHNTGRMIRIPVHVNESINKIKRIRNNYYNENGSYPNVEQIMKLTDYSKAKVELCLKNLEDVGSLDSPVGEMQHGEQTTVGDFVKLDYSLEDEAISNARIDEIREMIDSLNEREREIILLRFGFEDGNPYTLEQVGAKFNLTRERIRQIEAKALRKLKIKMRKSNFKR